VNVAGIKPEIPPGITTTTLTETERCWYFPATIAKMLLLLPDQDLLIVHVSEREIASDSLSNNKDI
jgi:hypothetical protein